MDPKPSVSRRRIRMTRSKSMDPCQKCLENLEPDLFERLYCYHDGYNHADDHVNTPMDPDIPKSVSTNHINGH